MSTIKTIAFDMDEVIVDTFKKTLRVFNKHFNMNLTKDDLIGNHFRNFITMDNWKEYYNVVNTKGFFRDLEIMEYRTRDVLEQMSKKYEIFICTAAMEVPNSLEDKYLWLREELPFLNPHNFVFCGTKAALHADILVDDNPTQLERFTGKGIIYTSPFNQDLETPFERVNNWDDIAKMFL